MLEFTLLMLDSQQTKKAVKLLDSKLYNSFVFLIQMQTAYPRNLHATRCSKFQKHYSEKESFVFSNDLPKKATFFCFIALIMTKNM